MMNKQAWSHFLHWFYYDQDLEFSLDLSHMGLTDDDITELTPRFKTAFSAMRALQAGDIANPDENRLVGHYWLRDPDSAPDSSISHAIKSTFDKIESFAENIHCGTLAPPSAGKFTDLLVIGIGGSALGPQFVSDALSSSKTPMAIHFLDNTDPDGMDRIFQGLENHLEKTLVLVISKSGGTMETRNSMLETQNRFNQRELVFARHAVAITGEGSQLHKLAKQENWLEVFPMWDWVGGRTSIMSAVGLLPAALMGIPVRDLLSGARKMDSTTIREDVAMNPAALLAMAWHVAGNGKGRKDMVILPYKDRLIFLSRYLQQLIMESLGKELDLDGNRVSQGIAVYGNKGSTDQHAYVQQLRDGLDNFFVTFIEILKDRQGYSPLVDEHNTSGDYLFGFLHGTQSALSEKGRKFLTITLGDISPESIGALIALYERAVGFYASLVNINAYHQPGVEAGKRAANQVLTTQKKVMDALKQQGEFVSFNELDHLLNADVNPELLYKLLRHLKAQDRIEIKGSFSDPELLAVKIRDDLKN